MKLANTNCLLTKHRLLHLISVCLLSDTRHFSPALYWSQWLGSTIMWIYKQNRANFEFSQLSWRTVKSTYRYLHRVGHPYFVLPILCQCFKKIHIFKNFAVKKCQDKFTNISVPRSSLFNFDTSLSKLVVTTSQRSNLKKIIHLAPPIIGLNIFFSAFAFWRNFLSIFIKLVHVLLYDIWLTPS